MFFVPSKLKNEKQFSYPILYNLKAHNTLRLESVYAKILLNVYKILSLLKNNFLI